MLMRHLRLLLVEERIDTWLQLRYSLYQVCFRVNAASMLCYDEIQNFDSLLTQVRHGEEKQFFLCIIS